MPPARPVLFEGFVRVDAPDLRLGNPSFRAAGVGVAPRAVALSNVEKNARLEFGDDGAGWLRIATHVDVDSFALALHPGSGEGGALARVLPKDETESVSQSGLVGRMATIVLGTARAGSPAQAKVRDQHGQMHYVMLEPDDAADAFGAGDSVLLISHSGAVYRAIRDDNPALKTRG